MGQFFVSDKPIVKPASWHEGETKPARVAGRPRSLSQLKNATKSQFTVYARISRNIYKHIEELEKLALSKNERIRLEAIKILLDKVLPNKKVEEYGAKHAPITVLINNQGFVPPNPDIVPEDGDITPPPDRGFGRPAQIQGAGVAPEGKEDDNGGERDSKTGGSKEGSVLAPVSDLRGS